MGAGRHGQPARCRHGQLALRPHRLPGADTVLNQVAVRMHIQRTGGALGFPVCPSRLRQLQSLAAPASCVTGHSSCVAQFLPLAVVVNMQTCGIMADGHTRECHLNLPRSPQPRRSLVEFAPPLCVPAHTPRTTGPSLWLTESAGHQPQQRVRAHGGLPLGTAAPDLHSRQLQARGAQLLRYGHSRSRFENEGS